MDFMMLTSEKNIESEEAIITNRDIAAELEDYLEELETITISFEDGKSVDFAEAALLIQGSACIYSKKVEHLYALVYHVLDQVENERRKRRGFAGVARARSSTRSTSC